MINYKSKQKHLLAYYVTKYEFLFTALDMWRSKIQNTSKAIV